MVTKKEKEKMIDYLVSHLEEFVGTLTPKRKQLIRGIESSYVLFGQNGGKDGIVFLVDQPYTNNSLSRISTGAKAQGLDIGFIFYKDGKTFFRSAAKDKRFKKNDLSLKYYSDEDVNAMISFRPEEEYVWQKKSWLQYFQPESERLKEGIVSYQFEPVVYDYSHIPAGDRHTNLTENSKKLRIIVNKGLNQGPYKLEEGILIPVKKD